MTIKIVVHWPEVVVGHTLCEALLLLVNGLFCDHIIFFLLLSSFYCYLLFIAIFCQNNVGIELRMTDQPLRIKCTVMKSLSHICTFTVLTI